jgi:hypothetical protein
MRWVGRVASTEEKRGSQGFGGEIFEGKTQLGRPRLRRKDKIKMVV